MNIFMLQIVTMDVENEKTEVSTFVYDSKEKAKKAFDLSVERHIDIFDDLDEEYSIDSSFPEDMPDEEMTDENCLSLCFSNDTGLFVTIDVEEKEVM